MKSQGNSEKLISAYMKNRYHFHTVITKIYNLLDHHLYPYTVGLEKQVTRPLVLVRADIRE